MSRVSNEPRTAFLRRAHGLDNAGAGVEQLAEGIQSHVGMFVDVPESKRAGKPVVTRASTAEALRLLGCEVTATAALGDTQGSPVTEALGGALGRMLALLERAPGLGEKLAAFDEEFGAHALLDVFAKRATGSRDRPLPVVELHAVGVRTRGAGAPGAEEVGEKWAQAAAGLGEHAQEVARRAGETLGRMRHVAQSDTGSFRQSDGKIDPEKAAGFFLRCAGAKGHVTLPDLERYFRDAGPPGKILNELELRLAFDLLGQIRTDGTKVLTAEQWVSFLDHPFEGLAEARAEKRLHVPVGEPKHDGAKKVAQLLAGLTGQYGGLHADAGTVAAYAAAHSIDVEASLAEQQKMKTLGPALGGAMLLLCPFKGGAALAQRPAEAR